MNIEHQNALLWEVSISEFLLVTVVLAGGAAFLTGRAVARSWESNTQLLIYMILLACGCRFIHFALFQGTLLTIHYYVVDLIILCIVGFLGKRYTRARQMTSKYGFEYVRSNALNWSRKSSVNS